MHRYSGAQYFGRFPDVREFRKSSKVKASDGMVVDSVCVLASAVVFGGVVVVCCGTEITGVITVYVLQKTVVIRPILHHCYKLFYRYIYARYRIIPNILLQLSKELQFVLKFCSFRLVLSCLSYNSLFIQCVYFGLRPQTRFSSAAPFILTVEGLLVHVNKIVICSYSDQST